MMLQTGIKPALVVLTAGNSESHALILLPYVCQEGEYRKSRFLFHVGEIQSGLL